MNDIVDIKKMLGRYYEGESTDLEEQRLREYFTSGNVAAELQPYRAIFAYLQHEKEQPSEPEENTLGRAAIIESGIPLQPVKWWYIAALAAACLLAFIFFPHEHQPASQTLCTGTYVMINGICYNDPALVGKYAAETINEVTRPFGESSAADALDFLSEE